MTEHGNSRHSLCLTGKKSKTVYVVPVASQSMSPRLENQNEAPHVRDGRRRELRELLVAAANAARATRQKALGVTLGRTSRRAVRERMAAFSPPRARTLDAARREPAEAGSPTRHRTTDASFRE